MKVSKSLKIGDLAFNSIPMNSPSLGLVVSKSYGNSATRNLFKRRCRSLFRIIFINRGISIALIVRPKKQNISFMDMNRAFEGLYEKNII